MSGFTFNIADYRPLSAVRAHATHDSRPALRESRGFAILTPHANRGGYDGWWPESRPAVVDIRTVRETHRMVQRSHHQRGKVLQFTGESALNLYPMPANTNESRPDDDPDPIAA